MIVVGVDGSTGAASALSWSLEEAAQRAAHVTAVRVWSGMSGVTRASVQWQHAAKSELERLTAQVERVAGVPQGAQVDCRLAEGEPASVLMQIAADHDADLLVVGRRAHGRFTRVLVGSVSQRCANSVHRPLVVVPPSYDRHPPRRIVVGIDDAAESVEVLRWAADEAARWSARLIVVHAYSARLLESPSEAYAHANTATDRVIEKALGNSLPAPLERLTVEGLPASALLEQAARADLLVVGTPGHPAAAALLASITSQCLEHSPVPVVIVRGW